MNFLAGFILLVSGGKEKESFWVFLSLLEKSSNDGLSGFYAHGFPLLMQYLNVFGDLFGEHLPDLRAHLEAEGFPDQLWIYKWFMSSFLYSFPLGLCIRIWDNIFARGPRFMFNISLSILNLVQEELLELDFGEINDFFNSLLNKDDRESSEGVLDKEKIIEGAQKIEISGEHLNELFQKY